jgi:hypothetical protein
VLKAAVEMNMRHLALGLAIGMAVVGCGSEDPAGSGGSGGTGTGQGGSGGGAAADFCSAAGVTDVTDLSGRWAYQEVLGEVVIAPGFSDPLHSRTVTFAVIDVTQSGADLSMDGPVCDVYIEDAESPVHTNVTDAFWSVFSPLSRTATFSSADGSLVGPDYYVVGGAELTEPETEALPTEPDDPRVRDDDNDGKPGLTTPITGLFDGEIYTTMRKITAIDGVAVSADSIQGKATYTAERNILASDPPSLKDNLSGAEYGPDPDPCTSYFRMVRIGDADDCASVLARVDTLFP